MAPSRYNPTMKTRLTLLWAIVGLFLLGAAISVTWYHGQVQQEEFDRTRREATLANDAFAEHTRQIISQADNLLRAVRSYYLHTRSIAQTEAFIATLALEKGLYENIYLIDTSGKVVIAHDAVAKGRNTSDREYFRFHSTTPDDVIYFAPTDQGRITQKYYFRITRRITLPNGEFGGVLLLNVRPTALTDYFGRLSVSANSIVALASIRDRKIRARYPEPLPSAFDRPLDTPLWDALAKAPAGIYRNRSAVDDIERQFIYTQVGNLPLVMVHGFSEADIQINVIKRMRLITLAALSACALLVMLAFILSLVLRSRVVQHRYLAELQESNDRSVALFNATNEAVILLDIDHPIDCNPQALAMFGVSSKAEFLALPPWSPQITPPAQPDGSETQVFARRNVEAAFRNGTHRFEYLHRRLDTGEEFLADIFLTAIQFKGRSILQAVLRDITQRVRFEQEIQTANDELIRRNREQDQFLSMLSHELKTPISVIQILAGNQDVPPSVRDRISRSIGDMNTLIERCVLSGQLEHGGVDVIPIVCSVDQLILNIQSASGTPERMTIQVETSFPCTTDAQLLNVILTNLVENALKYGAKATPIDIRVTPAVDAGRAGLQVEIANATGAAGRPDPQLVFSKYYRERGAQGESGSGLGLYIAAGLARKIGGVLRYRPTHDHIVFTLWIPR